MTHESDFQSTAAIWDWSSIVYVHYTRLVSINLQAKFVIFHSFIICSNFNLSKKEKEKWKNQEHRAKIKQLTNWDPYISVRHLIFPQLPLQMCCYPYCPKRPFLGQYELRIEHLSLHLWNLIFKTETVSQTFLKSQNPIKISKQPSNRTTQILSQQEVSDTVGPQNHLLQHQKHHKQLERIKTNQICIIHNRNPNSDPPKRTPISTPKHTNLAIPP